MPEYFRGPAGPTKAVDSGPRSSHQSLPDDVAYLVTKTVVENKAELVKAHQAFGDFTPEEAWKPENNGIPLHPGAARYYGERGWLKTAIGRTARGGADSAPPPLNALEYGMIRSLAWFRTGLGAVWFVAQIYVLYYRRSRCWRGRSTS